MDQAEELFRRHGLRAVSLSDLAKAVGIRKPSMYHHFPGGKEELFVEVQIRMYTRVGIELSRVLKAASPDLERQLHEGAAWFLKQPPMFLLNMMHADMDELSEKSRELVSRASYGLIMQPLVQVVVKAQENGIARDIDAHSVAGAFLAMMESNTIAFQAGFGGPDLSSMVHQSIDLLTHGILSKDACG